MNNKGKLIVDISAHVSWLMPPENTEEEVMRSEVDTQISYLAHQMQDEVAERLKGFMIKDCTNELYKFLDENKKGDL